MTDAHEIHFDPVQGGGLIDWDRVQPIRIGHALWSDDPRMPDTQVRTAYTADRLHLCFRVYEPRPTVRYRRTNEPVYRDSCVEFFVQPCPDDDGRYLNFEFNAAGTMLLGLGEGRGDRQYLDGVEPAAFRIRTAVDRTDERDGRVYWELEFSVPFDWLQSLFPAFSPSPGRRMRGNFYKCGDDTPQPHYGSWSRVTSAQPDFHRSCDFGELTFVK